MVIKKKAFSYRLICLPRTSQSLRSCINQVLGFTLIEVMITLVIMGVVAGLAVPAYFSTVEQARTNEARVNLAIIRMGEKIYALKDPLGRYWSPGGGFAVNGAIAGCPTCGGGINQTLNVDITPACYSITNITGTTVNPPGTLSIAATRNAVLTNGCPGNNTGVLCVLTMDESGIVVPGAGC